MENSVSKKRVIGKVKILSNLVVAISVDKVRVKISIDDLASEKYKKGMVLSEAGWQRLLRLSIEFLAKNYSLKLLSYSAKSESETKRKIKDKIVYWLWRNKIETSKRVIDEVVFNSLTFLKKRKFVDDDAYVESILRRYKDKSKKEIYFKLIGKGVDREIINNHLNNFDDRERMAIRACIIKKNRAKTIVSEDEKKKLLASLYRKGFSIRLAKTEIDDLIQNK